MYILHDGHSNPRPHTIKLLLLRTMMAIHFHVFFIFSSYGKFMETGAVWEHLLVIFLFLTAYKSV